MSLTSLSIEQRILKLLRHCTFEQLKKAHGFLITSSLAQHPTLSSLCIRRAAELGKTEHAELLLSSDDPPHILKWNALIRGCVQYGHHRKALDLSDQMPQRGLTPNEFTFSDVFTSCSSLREHTMGKKTHCRVLKAGFDLIPSVAISLFNFFLASGNVIQARKIFDAVSSKTVGLWNKMISLHARIGDTQSARILFDQMPERDVVSWNAMLSSYARAKNTARAMDLFHIMPERNVFSWTVMLKALSDAGDFCGARRLFDEMPERNVVSWNCMLSSYTQNGRFKQAMDLFFHMQSSGILPDAFTLVSVLSACANLGDLKTGKWINLHYIGNGLQFGSIIGTSLMEMYAKCGDIDSAFRIFIKTSEKDVFCWNVMIKALAIHGRAADSLQLFTSLMRQKIELNDFTFASVLFACNHGGLVEEGRRIFKAMETEYKIKPRIEHYGCLIDLLSRAGKVEEAYRVAKEMPFEPDIFVWGALFGGCRAENDAEFADRVLEGIWKVENDGSGVYSILSNMYAASSRWSEAERVREKMKEMRIWKTAGCSSVVDATTIGPLDEF